MTLQDVQKRYNEGFYNPPKKLDNLGRLDKNYIFDENKTVRENRDMVEEHNRKLKEMVASFDHNIHKDVVECLRKDYFTQKIAEIIENYVYENEHSNMDIYFERICSVAQFVSEILYAKYNEDRE